MPHLVQLHQKEGIWLDTDLSCLSDVREYLRETVQDHLAFCIDDEDVQESLNSIQLAATELVSNVIRHGFPNCIHSANSADAQEKINISAFFNRKDQMVVQVAHSGDPFDGNTAEVHEITSPQEGQMGLYIISQCVDHVYYASTARWNSYVWLFRNFPQH